MANQQRSFNVTEIDNGFVLQANGVTVSFASAKGLVAYLREYLGLPIQGRPKIEKTNATVIELFPSA